MAPDLSTKDTELSGQTHCMMQLLGLLLSLLSLTRARQVGREGGGIVGGEEAAAGEFPHQVQCLYYD